MVGFFSREARAERLRKKLRQEAKAAKKREDVVGELENISELKKSISRQRARGRRGRPGAEIVSAAKAVGRGTIGGLQKFGKGGVAAFKGFSQFAAEASERGSPFTAPVKRKVKKIKSKGKKPRTKTVIVDGTRISIVQPETKKKKKKKRFDDFGFRPVVSKGFRVL